MVLKLRGGAPLKRKKGSDEEAPSTAQIPEIIGEVTVKDGDAKAVHDAICGNINIKRWLSEMNIENLEMVRDFLGKYETRGNSDFVVKGLAKHMPTIVALDAEIKRVSGVHAYELSKIKTAVLTNGKPEVMRKQVSDTITDKQNQAQSDAIASAVAKAKAEPRGGLMGLFV